jgi:mannose-6-phosphate isomerase-like protein (cupin superfamily)
MVEPYVLHAGEGRVYRWHGVRVEVKAGSPELGGEMALTETVTKKGEEPHVQVHENEDELFYLLDGKLTLRCNNASYDVEERAFVFVPKGTPHTYEIRSEGRCALSRDEPARHVRRQHRTDRRTYRLTPPARRPALGLG